MPSVKLRAWARENGISGSTAYKWYREGKLPYPARRLGTRTIVVDVPDEPEDEGSGFGLYARVSSHSQKGDLERQTARLCEWAARSGVRVVAVVSEVGSGMSDTRPKVRRLLADPAVRTVVVEHREHLGRMNVGLVEAALQASGRKLVVLDDGEVDDDLVRDITEVLTSFCARLYGRRGARNRALAAVKCAETEVPVSSEGGNG